MGIQENGSWGRGEGGGSKRTGGGKGRGGSRDKGGQPRPQGFSLPFFEGKALGTRLKGGEQDK